MNAKELSDAILKALGCEDHPAGVLVEAVIEKEFGKYEDLLTEINEILEPSYADDYTEINELVRKIDKVKNG